MTGTNGGPITNLKGAIPNIDGSVTDPSMASVAVGTGLGQTSDSSSSFFSLNVSSEVKRKVATSDAGGGFAIGNSDMNSMFNEISLPEKAFTDQQPKQKLVDTPTEQLPVDMSMFIPPPIEEPPNVPQFNERIPNQDISQHPGLISDIITVDNSIVTSQQSAEVVVNRADSSRLSTDLNVGAGSSALSSFETNAASNNDFQYPRVPNTKLQPRFRPAKWQMATQDSQRDGAITESFAIGSTQSQANVGSITGSTASRVQPITSNTPTDAQDAAVDFMTSFLSAKSTKNPSRNLNLEIVPIGTDLSHSQNNPNNVFVVGQGRSDSSMQPQDQFGVADIYTRKQLLDSNEWSALMKTVSNNANTKIGAVPYETQNVIATGETRPFDARVKQSPLVGGASPFVTSRQIRRGDSSGSHTIATLFQAPGMTGHKSVAIPSFSFQPQVSVDRIGSNSQLNGATNSIMEKSSVSNTIVDKSSQINTAQTNMDRLSKANTGSNSLLGKSSQIDRTSTVQDFNSLVARQNELNDMGTSGIRNQEQNAFSAGKSVNMNNALNTMTNEEFTQVSSLDTQTFEQSSTNDRSPMFGRGKTADHTDFKLGKSIMISDGTIPSFVMEGKRGTMSAADIQADIQSMSDIQNMASNGFRLGQPVVMQKVDPSSDGMATTNVDTFNQNSFISTNQQLNNVARNNFVSRNNQGNAINQNNFVSTDAQLKVSATDVNVDMVGGPQSSSMTKAINEFLSQSKQNSVNDVTGAAGLQPGEATAFTSGNRRAVFGPAAGEERTADRFLARVNKPAKAVRMGILGPVSECRYIPDPSSRYFFIYKNGKTVHRFRCALGTAFDEMTCECSIRVNDDGKCRPLK